MGGTFRDHRRHRSPRPTPTTRTVLSSVSLGSIETEPTVANRSDWVLPVHQRQQQQRQQQQQTGRCTRPTATGIDKIALEHDSAQGPPDCLVHGAIHELSRTAAGSHGKGLYRRRRRGSAHQVIELVPVLVVATNRTRNVGIDNRRNGRSIACIALHSRDSHPSIHPNQLVCTRTTVYSSTQFARHAPTAAMVAVISKLPYRTVQSGLRFCVPYARSFCTECWLCDRIACCS
mmetsp:Transcript_7800/g.15204  ORF Transcript_7800/g.15204 Transcript_7800/m.15204 type:complete len:232 (+) Transcript_7800:431-1126(+)